MKKDFDAFVTEAKALVAAGFEAAGATNSADDAARSMSLVVGLPLHPIVSEDPNECIHVNEDAIDGHDPTTGAPTRTAFAFLETAEDFRLTDGQISRRGNGLKLTGKTKVERLCDFVRQCLDIIEDGHTPVLTCVQKFDSPLAGGGVQRVPRFSLTAEQRGSTPPTRRYKCMFKYSVYFLSMHELIHTPAKFKDGFVIFPDGCSLPLAKRLDLKDAYFILCHKNSLGQIVVDKFKLLSRFRFADNFAPKWQCRRVETPFQGFSTFLALTFFSG